MKPMRLFFLHVPKCAGRSVRTAIVDALRSDGMQDDAYFALSAKASLAAARALGEDLFATRDRLLGYHLALPRMRFVSGHFRLNRVILTALQGSWSYATLFREPFSQFVSEYYFNRFKTSDHFRIDTDLASFVRTDRAREMGAKYARLLAGAGFEALGPMDPKLLQVAQDNLALFQVLGIHEDLPGFTRRLGACLGLDIALPHLNRSPRPDGLMERELTTEVAARIHELCAPNAVVYEAVRSRCRAD
jgi:hypothetical protein